MWVEHAAVTATQVLRASELHRFFLCLPRSALLHSMLCPCCVQLVYISKCILQRKLEDALRALLVKYEDEKRKTAQKLSKMATIFNQLQNQEEDQVQISVAPLHRALSAPKSNRSMRHSSSPSETGR